VEISAPYVILRGFTLKGGSTNGIELKPGAHDVVIEKNDISGWGRSRGTGQNGTLGVDMDSAIRARCNDFSLERVVIQRNKMHDPRYTANSWDSQHPAGPQGITFSYCGGNNVFRYNEIYSTNGNFFNDPIGGEDNFSTTGFPNRDSDIYGNKISMTWDDGIEAEGLQTMRRALAALEGVRLVVIAPDGNRSAMARSITTRRPLWVAETPFADGSVGYATDGTPVDCVRLASLGLVEGFSADLVISGINHGANLGDDITYSGTVAAALEGVVLGLPAIAVSQQSGARALDYRFDGGFGFDVAATFVARWVERIEEVKLPDRTLINVNVPAGEPTGVEVTSLGKRIYRDELKLEHEEQHRRRYWIYGSDPGFEDEPGTDLAAVHAGRIAVTPIHFDLTHRPGLELLRRYDLQELFVPVAPDAA